MSTFILDRAHEALDAIIGKTMTSVVRTRDDDDDDIIMFTATTGEQWRMFYDRDCCAKCSIEDICGDLADLESTPILMAEAASSRLTNDPDATTEAEALAVLAGEADDYDDDDSHTWTFYKFATVKGYVTIRWYGSSNGFYSETASFERVEP